MSKQLESLFKNFLTEMTGEEQLEKIQSIRHTRTIERPAVAVKRKKKEETKAAAGKTKIKGILSQMSPEEKAALLAKMKEEM